MNEQQAAEIAEAWVCETATAGPWTPMHLRRLSAAGPKCGGGADSPALCGRQVAWDVRRADTRDLNRQYTCSRCVETAGLLIGGGLLHLPPASEVRDA